MRFINETTNKKISDCIARSESLLLPDSSMMLEVKERDCFKYDSGNGLTIWRLLHLTQKQTRIYLYDPGYDSNAIATYKNGVHLFNKRKLPFLTSSEIIGNILHEWAHACGFHHVDPGMWGWIRRNYKTEHKCKYSVPYWLSENVGRWI